MDFSRFGNRPLSRTILTQNSTSGMEPRANAVISRIHSLDSELTSYISKADQRWHQKIKVATERISESFMSRHPQLVKLENDIAAVQEAVSDLKRESEAHPEVERYTRARESINTAIRQEKQERLELETRLFTALEAQLESVREINGDDCPRTHSTNPKDLETVRVKFVREKDANREWLEKVSNSIDESVGKAREAAESLKKERVARQKRVEEACGSLQTELATLLEGERSCKADSEGVLIGLLDSVAERVARAHVAI
ncbi:Chromosome partition protein Smc [Carpediemonas membranifera]|uniref:Chromosome partition protein Smc n=1 Tax=Carpediemonas membranifera TaxID=201153 RepID=A0A8J6B3U3_9EUKA|nr:Chromosome partition protein Smc [Carpediemonas membranifera]|eukprot:KAG9393724.1 Chromosome partition protein Smc [Carpediemonas membranifera]